MKKYTFWFLGLGFLLLLIAGLGALQWRARYEFAARGSERGFPAPLADASLPRACVNAALEQYTAPRLEWAADQIAAGGFVWVRQRFPWAEIEPQPGAFRWERWDAVLAALTARGLRPIAVLDMAPAWAGAPPDPQAFARFAAAFATRYADTVTYYQVWHNPNLGGAWGGTADARAYAALLAQAAGALRAADPDARILLGSLAPTTETGPQNWAEDLFLEHLYAAGAAPYFDGVAAQPYGFNSGPEDRRVSRETLNVSRVVRLREVLMARGEAHKAVWMTHLGWNSLPATESGPASIWGSVDAATQISYTLAALQRAEREWPWAGPLCLNSFQPRPETPGLTTPDAEEHWGFALVGPDDTPRPLYAAVRTWNSRPPLALPGGYSAGTPLAVFTGTWTLGPQGADIGQSGDRVALTFEGTGVALTVRRGPYRAFLFVTVDGRPAPALPRDPNGQAYVVLYDPLAAVATVPLAEGLPYGRHTVEVLAERGWGQWALADWRIAGAQPPSDAGWWLWGLLGLTGAALLTWQAPALLQYSARWMAFWNTLRARTRTAVAVGMSALYIFAAWQVLYAQPLFRRLGEGGGLAALALAASMFYLSPWLLLALAAGAVVALMVLAEPALGLALTLAAAPLYMHPISLIGKSFSLAELVLLPTLAGWAVALAGKRRTDAGRSPTGPRSTRALVIGLVVLSLLATLAAAHQREAFREWRLVLVEPALFYLMLTTLPLTARERWRIVDAFVASACGVALIGLVQFFLLGDVITAEGGALRLRSVYGSPNNVGLFLGRALPLMLAVALWGGDSAGGLRAWLRDLWRSPRRRAYTLALLPVGLALLLSLSRGALVLGIPAALFTLGMLAGKTWRRATVAAVLIGALALIPLLRLPRFAALLDPSQGTAGFRLALWHSSWSMMQDHPWLGVGPDNFLYAYRTRYVLPTAWEEFNLAHPHNLLLDFAVRMGVLGPVLLLLFQADFWRRAWRLRAHPDAATRALAWGVMASMADFLAHGLVDAAYFVIDLAFVFFFSLALVTWLERDSQANG